MSAVPPRARRLLQLARELGVPLEIVTEKLAILGQSGAGKTYTAMRLAELLLQAGLQVIIVDLVGCWWGLRASQDGKRGGLPILVIGGQHGDLPLSAAAGGALARLIVERRLSVVIDASELGTGELFQFARDFAEALFAAKKRAPSPVHVLLEEAHELLAEDPLGKEGAAVHAAWVRICKLGRNYGIGYTLVSQEPQALSKRALGQVGTMIAMRTQGEYAQRVVLGWARTYLRPVEQEALKAQLPAMATGEAFIASPFFLKTARRDHITKRETFDSSRTPEVGEVLEAPATLAPVEVQQLREQFAGLVEQLEQEDPAALQRRVKELEKELAAARKATPTAEPAPPKEVPVIDRATLARLEGLHRAAGQLADGLVNHLRPVEEAATSARAATLGLLESTRAILGRLAQPGRPMPALRQAPAPPARRGGLISDPGQVASAVQLKAGERRMLQVLARAHPVKRSAAQLGTLSGFTPSGGTFRTYLGVLKRHQLVREAGDLLEVTTAGLALAGNVALERPQNTEEVLAMWRGALKAGERAMLDALVKVYPDAMSRGALGAHSGFAASGGTFRTYLGVLVRNGLAETDGDEVRASSALFLAGDQAA
jgi:hypothetical protein